MVNIYIYIWCIYGKAQERLLKRIVNKKNLLNMVLTFERRNKHRLLDTAMNNYVFQTSGIPKCAQAPQSRGSQTGPCGNRKQTIETYSIII